MILLMIRKLEMKLVVLQHVDGKWVIQKYYQCPEENISLNMFLTDDSNITCITMIRSKWDMEVDTR